MIYDTTITIPKKKRNLKLTKEDREWALKVKERDNFCCVVCGSTIKPNAHHIIVREQHLTKLDLNNGITLCNKHHLFCRRVSAHNNPVGFWLWLEKNRPEQLNYIRTKMEELLDGDSA